LVLDREGPLRVEIRDLLGRRVRTLAEGSRAGGEHLVRWDGSDDSGRPLPAGAYWVRVDAGAGARQRLTVLLR
jgi:flagellar hook assembly protein FlgD